MEQDFINQKQLFNILKDSDASGFLHVDGSSEFLAECIFLNHWNQQLKHQPENNGVDDLEVWIKPNRLSVLFSYRDEEIVLLYTPDDANPGKHALEISHNGVTVYSRQANQNPATEWNINALADYPANKH